jgi:hypothetical protein
LEEDFDEEETMGGLPISKEQPIATEESGEFTITGKIGHDDAGAEGLQGTPGITSTQILDDDSFIISAVEVKKSTAKKVKA